MRFAIFYGICATCGRVCALHNPRLGDGSTRITYWHKRRSTGGSEWCRSEVPDDWYETREAAAHAAQALGGAA